MRVAGQTKRAPQAQAQADAAQDKRGLRRREERRRQIMSAVAPVLAEHGLDGPTMDDLAKAAKISRVLLYRHFASKNDLTHSVLEDFLRAWEAAAPDPTEGAEAELRKTMDLVRSRPAEAQLLVRHAAHNPEFSGYFQRIKAFVTARTVDRLRARYGPVDAFCAETVTAFVIDAVVNYVRTEPDPAGDSRFMAWLTQSMRHIYRSWYEGR